MISALPASFALAWAQLADRRILAILAKSLALTLAIFGLLGVALWFVLGWALAQYQVNDSLAQGLFAAIGMVIGGWLLFRIVALMVLQAFGDEVVQAVEARHYPAAAASARPLGWRREFATGLKALARTLIWNLAALPVALLLLVTAIGPAVVFGLVNAVLLGRELSDMARMRHPDLPGPGAVTRFVLGGIVTALMLVPFVNFFAPVLGAAMATHLVHRRA